MQQRPEVRKIVVDDPLRFIIEAKLSDGSFDSSLSVPITASADFVKTSFEAWTGTLYAAIEALARGGRENEEAKRDAASSAESDDREGKAPTGAA